MYVWSALCIPSTNARMRIFTHCPLNENDMKLRNCGGGAHEKQTVVVVCRNTKKSRNKRNKKKKKCLTH